MLHIFAGGRAMAVGRALGVAKSFSVSGALGGCVVTLVTGAILITAAEIIGMFFQGVIWAGERLPGWAQRSPYCKPYQKSTTISCEPPEKRHPRTFTSWNERATLLEGPNTKTT